MQAEQLLIAENSSMQWRKASECYNTDSDQAILDINHPLIMARASLQGAQLLECKLKGIPVLWLSPNAIFDGNTAIRGGIPVCLPWFGVNQQNPSLPKHGFARNENWQLIDASESPRAVTLVFQYSALANALFPHAFSATLRYLITETGISAEFSLQNTSTSEAEFSYALHSYLNVTHSESAFVSGLDNHRYLDNTEGFAEKQQQGAIHFLEEVDRVYPECSETQVLTSENTLHISATNMPSAIVWNPGKAAVKVKDIGTAYHQYVCVERGAVLDDAITLAPNQSHNATMRITLA